MTTTGALPQGDVRLLDHPVALRLLASTELAAAAALAETDGPGLRMARTGLRPDWVGLLDFATRFPGGGTAEDFARRGRR